MRTETIDTVLADWQQRTLDELCSLRKELVEPSLTGDNRYVGLEHLDSGIAQIRRWATDAGLRSTKSRFYPEDILYGKLRPYLDKAALAQWEGVCSTDILTLSPRTEVVDPRYLSFLLHTSDFINHAIATTSGVNHPRTSWVGLVGFVYRIPPLPEQRAIAAVLSKIQAAVEVQEKIIATLKELKAATMAKLFREGIIKGLMFDSNVFDDLVDGKLDLNSFPQNLRIYATHIQRDELNRCPNDERRAKLANVLVDVSKSIPTASCALGTSRLGEARLGDGPILEEIRGNSLKKTNDALIAETAIKEGLVLVTNDQDLKSKAIKAGGETISTEDLLAGKLRPMKETEIGEIPENWEVVRLKKITNFITKGSSPNWQGFQYRQNGVLFVRSQNIGLGELLLSEVVYLPEEFNIKERRSILLAGDLLINIVGASIGRAAVADERLNHANINQAVALVRFQPRFNPFFFMYFLMTQGGLRQMDRKKKEIARANLSLEDVGSFLVPLPPHVEQDEIAALLQSIIDRIQGAEQKRDSFKYLFSSMLHLLMTGQTRVNNLIKTNNPSLMNENHGQIGQG